MKTLPSEDQHYMQIALLQADKAFSLGEVPVGAVVVMGGELIAEAHNEVESLKQASAHAEMLALQRAAEALGGWRLTNCTLYTTLEPCAMCLGAIWLFRVARVVYAAPDLRHGALGSWLDLSAVQHPTHRIEIQGGVYLDESAERLRSFFRARRETYGAVGKSGSSTAGENACGCPSHDSPSNG